MRFWDSSAVIPLLVPEEASSVCHELFAQDPLIVFWWGTPTEIDASLCRKLREGSLTTSQFVGARRRGESLFRTGFELNGTKGVRNAAYNLLRLHPLRAADSLQLAAALEFEGGRFIDLEFVCLDKRLREAAMAEGARVLP